MKKNFFQRVSQKKSKFKKNDFFDYLKISKKTVHYFFAQYMKKLQLPELYYLGLHFLVCLKFFFTFFSMSLKFFCNLNFLILTPASGSRILISLQNMVGIERSVTNWVHKSSPQLGLALYDIGSALSR